MPKSYFSDKWFYEKYSRIKTLFYHWSLFCLTSKCGCGFNLMNKIIQCYKLLWNRINLPLKFTKSLAKLYHHYIISNSHETGSRSFALHISPILISHSHTSPWDILPSKVLALHISPYWASNDFRFSEYLASEMYVYIW